MVIVAGVLFSVGAVYAIINYFRITAGMRSTRDAMSLPSSLDSDWTSVWTAPANLDDLQKTDPNFNDIEFLSHASKIYTTVLSAESARNLAALSGVTTSSLRDCLAHSADETRSQGSIEKISDVRFESAYIVKLSIDGIHQLIVVRFRGSWVRFTADAHTGILTRGSTQPRSFTEFATFVRPAGSKTPKSVAAGGPSYCPGCGAPVEPGSIVCPFCKTPLTGTGGIWQLDSVSLTPYV
jgi:hypothetical protein